MFVVIADADVDVLLFCGLHDEGEGLDVTSRSELLRVVETENRVD